ncbi:MAG TPA: response regulator [Candidatus Angelobacter sp.]
MSLRILFADDSMTAQNMGKKILTEAGYEVVAVSNGAAAVKKIAEQKPDIIILDVYMPGYSGLEVCEKVRGSLDTLKTPVLLTVGKMEPYKPEDANRVKADGVIIKPFEASDLLAIIRKFEERIRQTAPPPIISQAAPPEPQFREEPVEVEAHTQHSGGKSSGQPMVEVPDHMASSAAFNDMLGPDSTISPHHFAVNSPSAAFETSVIVPAPPVPAGDYEPTVVEVEPSAGEPVEAEPATVETFTAEPVEAKPEIFATPAADSAEPEMAVAPETEISAAPVEATVPEPPHPNFIPVFKEPEPEAHAYEVMHTAAPPTGDLEIPREPALQETAEETTRSTVADHVEPGLLSPIEQQMTTLSANHEEAASAVNENPAAVAQETSAQASEATIENDAVSSASGSTEVSDSDFEARVAAAMAAYSHANEAVPAPAPTVETPIAIAAEAAPATSAYAAPTFEPPSPPAEAAPTFEYQPPIKSPEPEQTVQAGSAPAETPEHASVPSAPEPMASEPAAVHQAVTAGVEAVAVAAAVETGAEHHTIAQAVHRVMERLKPELVEEIMRELRSKK